MPSYKLNSHRRTCGERRMTNYVKAVKGDLPKYLMSELVALNKAQIVFDKAAAAHDKAWIARDEALAALDKAWAGYDKAFKRAFPEIMKLHTKECGCDRTPEIESLQTKLKEAEEEIKRQILRADKKTKKILRFKAALGFYANKKTWFGELDDSDDVSIPALVDCGKRATQALKDEYIHLDISYRLVETMIDTKELIERLDSGMTRLTFYEQKKALFEIEELQLSLKEAEKTRALEDIRSDIETNFMLDGEWIGRPNILITTIHDQINEVLDKH